MVKFRYSEILLLAIENSWEYTFGMYRFVDIEHVHIEPSSRCNAACPMCARNARGATIPGLPLTELSASDIRHILSDELVEQLAGLDACGAYGDPAAATELIEIFHYIRERNHTCNIAVYSNGGLRGPEWWARLASVLGANGKAVFAIDGIGEVNGVHRRGVRYVKLMENVKAFLSAGGQARWEFLAFRHNEHQVDEARELSARMGFAEFSVKKSGRFLEPIFEDVPEYDGECLDLKRFPVFDPDGRQVTVLEPASARDLVNETLEDYYEQRIDEVVIESLLNKTAINCRVAQSRSIFIGSSGLVFPCCWTYVQATRPGYLGRRKGRKQELDRSVTELIAAHGSLASLDANRHGLRSIVEGEIFAEFARRLQRQRLSEGRLRICARSCGCSLPAYFDQFVEKKYTPQGLRDHRGDESSTRTAR